MSGEPWEVDLERGELLELAVERAVTRWLDRRGDELLERVAAAVAAGVAPAAPPAAPPAPGAAPSLTWTPSAPTAPVEEGHRRRAEAIARAQAGNPDAGMRLVLGVLQGGGELTAQDIRGVLLQRHPDATYMGVLVLLVDLNKAGAVEVAHGGRYRITAAGEALLR